MIWQLTTLSITQAFSTFSILIKCVLTADVLSCVLKSKDLSWVRYAFIHKDCLYDIV